MGRMEEQEMDGRSLGARGQRPADRDSAQPAAPGRIAMARLWPLVVLGLGLVLFLALGGPSYVSFETLRDNRADLLAWRAEHGVLAALFYVALYAAVTAFSLPVASILTLTGGFLFGWFWGGLWTVTGATLGATVLFLAARTALGESLRARAGPFLKRFEAGFRRDMWSYLFILRLVPAFPFWLVNLAPAFLGVPLHAFLVTTFLGILPGSFVFASVGAGLGAVFDRGEDPDVSGILTDPAVLLPILALIALALVPVVYKRLVRRPDLPQ
ncbi:MAG: TVP38/TMEM64 family protein [Alphaproteobacteria bacterium]|nr:TVP38/TMEM64 family protein [Alphaproteobacteria bacterium]MDX5369287.1 TVP38/TMEM64 family protein [Alphaproteobacteria bacterium]MDX5463972.1 TVP38/TMEM64 family protein [Alphaproteobacteria bacterium]